jgi:hypothetical protein
MLRIWLVRSGNIFFRVFKFEIYFRVAFLYLEMTAYPCDSADKGAAQSNNMTNTSLLRRVRAGGFQNNWHTRRPYNSKTAQLFSGPACVCG